MKTLAILTAVSLSAASAWAAELEGVKMPDQIKVAGKNLILNGMGMREATIFNVDVYAAGLYLENKSSDPDQIIRSPQVKKLVMHFVRDVDAGKIREAWETSFDKNCHENCSQLKPQLETLNSFMSDMKKGDEMMFTFLPTEVKVFVKGKLAGTLKSAAFSPILLSSWIGQDPPNKSLKSGLLGKRD